MIDPDPYENDPFFKRIFDGTWNACIGVQGHEENYMDGYIEAAIELADAIIEKELFGKRDTLVLPILYNARHALELSLKFANDRLIQAGVLNDDGRKLSHNIRDYWNYLHEGAVGDESLRKTIEDLRPYIDSLSQIDNDGQELRYHQNRDDDPSLRNYAIANLKLIRSSLHKLQKLLTALKYRTLEFVDERSTGSFTNRCSRTDLMTIAKLLPKRDAWMSDEFDEIKARVNERFGFGNKQFSVALDQIQKSREMNAVLGVETPLLYLTDDDVVYVIEEWRRIHPAHQPDGEGLDYFDPRRFEGMKKSSNKRKAALEAVEARLSPEALADLEAMFYLGRDGFYSEYYEQRVATTLREHEAANALTGEILHLLEKTNLLPCVQAAAVKLGRLSLAERLSQM